MASVQKTEDKATAYAPNHFFFKNGGGKKTGVKYIIVTYKINKKCVTLSECGPPGIVGPFIMTLGCCGCGGCCCVWSLELRSEFPTGAACCCKHKGKKILHSVLNHALDSRFNRSSGPV